MARWSVLAPTGRSQWRCMMAGTWGTGSGVQVSPLSVLAYIWSVSEKTLEAYTVPPLPVARKPSLLRASPSAAGVTSVHVLPWSAERNTLLTFCVPSLPTPSTKSVPSGSEAMTGSAPGASLETATAGAKRAAASAPCGAVWVPVGSDAHPASRAASAMAARSLPCMQGETNNPASGFARRSRGPFAARGEPPRQDQGDLGDGVQEVHRAHVPRADEHHVHDGEGQRAGGAQERDLRGDGAALRGHEEHAADHQHEGAHGADEPEVVLGARHGLERADAQEGPESRRRVVGALDPGQEARVASHRAGSALPTLRPSAASPTPCGTWPPWARSRRGSSPATGCAGSSPGDGFPRGRTP